MGKKVSWVKMYLVTLFAYLSLLWTCAAGECLSSMEVCEFSLDVEFKQTMVDKGNKLVYLHNGELYRYDVTNTSSATPTPVDEVITADGFETPRLVIAINGQMPGPAIVVHVGQKVVVNVLNNLHSDAISIHWHGIHQFGTPWMDGAAYVTQCPILPGHSFRYEFLANQVGTYFYHNHIGMLGTMGFHGPLIIKSRVPQSLPEHIVMLTEWNNVWEADLQLAKNMFGDYTNRVPFSVPAIDGTAFTKVKFHAGLINGKGRYYNEQNIPNNAPLTMYSVKEGSEYRFRVIGGGYAFPFKVSVDMHTLTLVASDGQEIEPVTAESFVIHNGERFDFIINANQPVGNYWLRAQTLEKGVDHKAEAVVHYEGAQNTLPTSSPRACTSAEPCVIVNCPFTIYPGIENSICKTFNDIKAKNPRQAFGLGESLLQEHFMNFGFPGAVGYRYASVNGRAFKMPQVPPLTQPREHTTTCNPDECGSQKICLCPYTIDLNFGKYYQFVFTNYGNGASGPHPIHLHGHAFQVLKMGYNQQNQSTGLYIAGNTDISCDGTYCNEPSWTNNSWTPSTIPDLETESPPMKDTIVIPKGGYAVVRITANNPGLWMLHCHMDPHTSRGMAMLLNESFSSVPRIPKGFPECRGFPAPDHIVKQMEDKQMGSSDEMDEPEMKEESLPKETFWVVVGVLLGLVALQFIVIAVICTKQRRAKSSFTVQ